LTVALTAVQDPAFRLAASPASTVTPPALANCLIKFWGRIEAMARFTPMTAKASTTATTASTTTNSTRLKPRGAAAFARDGSSSSLGLRLSSSVWG
jgi:hypothetical protein